MNEYLLTAELAGSGKSHCTIYASDDNAAIFEGTFEVLNRASDKGSGSRVIWANGAIRLMNKLTGEVIKTMDAK